MLTGIQWTFSFRLLGSLLSVSLSTLSAACHAAASGPGTLEGTRRVADGRQQRLSASFLLLSGLLLLSWYVMKSPDPRGEKKEH